MIYLDNNATTRPSSEVLSAIFNSSELNWANPSSVHSLGQSVSHIVAISREQVAKLLGVQPDRVVFTSGATEANEAVLRHYAKIGAALVTSSAEHPAVTGYYKMNQPQLIRNIPLYRSGLWQLDCLQETLENIDGPKLIAFSWANGETGVLQDLAAIKALAERYHAKCLIDASQAVGRVSFQADSTSFLSFSGHKLHGPKGIGILVQPEGSEMIQIAVGGGQENGYRGGTQNVPGIVGLGVACELRHNNLDSAIAQMSRLRDLFEFQVRDAMPSVQINGGDTQRVPNTCNLTVSGVDGMALVARLEDRGIYCSQVSACSSGQPEPSQTLLAMGLSRDEAYASLRVAVAVDNSEEDVVIAAQALVQEALLLREVMGGLI